MNAPPRVGFLRRWSTIDRWWLPVLVVYCLLYGILLLKTDGYPYVLDNNESYSSWWHARSIYENGVSNTKGLTDEVFAHHLAASPYIHSHQGNFPRLFTFALYAFGLRTIGPQIWVTTFTVGLAAVWLAFRFFSRFGNPLYAALACLMLMTDYVFFIQWQVGLYNIWHAFFFFSSLICVQSLGATERRGLWFAVSLLNFTALFYWEYVFTAFVTILCGLYAVVLYWRRFRFVLLSWSVVAAGAMIAAGVLLAQLTAYMGWGNVLEDVRLTLTARNATADPQLLERVTSFYRENRIIFWHNFLDAAPLRTFSAFWSSLVRFQLKYYTPAFVFTVVLLFSGWLLGRCQWPRRNDSKSRPEYQPTTGRTARGPGIAFGIDLLKAALTGLCVWKLIEILTDAKSAVAAVLTAWLLGFIWTGRPWGWQRIRWLRFIPMILFVVIAYGAKRASVWLSDDALRKHMIGASSGLIMPSVETLLVFAGVGIAFSCSALGLRPVLGRLRQVRMPGLVGFLVCGILAYAATYRLFTGYIYSGYLHRQIPMFVFVTAPVLALAIYVILQAFLTTLARLTRIPESKKGPDGRASSGSERGGLSQLIRRQILTKTGAVLSVLICILALGSGIAYWANLQFTYARLAPADNFAFLPLLERAPFKGHSLVTNVYPAPMVARTGSWGYSDPTVFSGMIRLTPRGYETERDFKYLWFADRESNQSYLKPELALNIVQAPNIEEAIAMYEAKLEPEYDPNSNPSEENGLFRRAKSPFQPFLRHRPILLNRKNLSAVQLDWDYPPFLKSDIKEFLPNVKNLTFEQKMALSASAQNLRRRWRVHFDTTHGPGQVILLEAMVDKSPLFTEREMTGAGWRKVLSGADGRTPAWALDSPLSRPLTAVVEGDLLKLAFWTSPQGGRLKMAVNNVTETIELATKTASPKRFEFTAAQPFGRYTSVPFISPGQSVQTTLREAGEKNYAEVRYFYVHQLGTPETGTTFRIYRESYPGRWELFESMVLLGKNRIPVRIEEFRRKNPDTISEHARTTALGDTRDFQQWLADHLDANPAERRRPGIATDTSGSSKASTASGGAVAVTQTIPLPDDESHRFQISVSPGTRTKLGPEYFGLPFFPSANAITNTKAKPVGLDLATTTTSSTLRYGRIKLRVKFPRFRQPEPLVTTGSNEAGDSIYVIYKDDRHIQIGFDHWFKGGPLTDPIPIDFDQEHELEISMGSLYPAENDIMFSQDAPAALVFLKNHVFVTLNGNVVIDSEATCYESSPDQVTIGKNLISATSSGPDFTGTIISVQRVWPEAR